MNKPLRRVSIFCGLLMMALLIRDNWIQFVSADELRNHKDNRRVAIARYAEPRGDIIVDGKSITGSTKTDGSDFEYKRTWKNGPMWAPVTGYSSQAFGASQLESINDGILTGDDDRLFFNRTLDMLSGGKKDDEGSVVTTLNAEAQKAAYEGLTRIGKGAAVALNPETGAILALASAPSYDPSTFAGNSTKDSEAWVKLQPENDPNNPMLNRAIRETYPPGSTFKVLTAAAGLESGEYDLDGKTDSPDPYRLPDTTTDLPNDGDIPCENASVRVALQYSCNTVFAKMADDVGNEAMREMAQKFGYGEQQFIPVRTEASEYPEENRPQNALGGIGQGSNRATPLQMAMIASAVANDGKLMKPYMVDKLQGPNLNVVEQTEPEELSEPMSSETAQQLQSAMETVVNEGTGRSAQIDGVTVGGKTGTAQRGENNSEKPLAWFISYAKTDQGTPVAVAVVVESDTARSEIAGGRLAAPIAKSVMEAVLESQR